MCHAGYPPDQAIEVALRTVREYLEENHEKLRFVRIVSRGTSDAVSQTELYLTQSPVVLSSCCGRRLSVFKSGLIL
ncbi:hypothetical protein E1301_Tti004021 [Triplophysa tibetana]|uniref:Uncharacterized protein n=1 Tax=Triplophysa tibetana TaxID=1572043 RepID=A0A5A9NHV7_9TELE|nr:hypothetical protein E1301_Tti004021 [Triplophysa tibetana]